MTLSYSSITIKYLLFIFNFLFVISGIIILSVGVTIKAEYNPYNTFLQDQYFSAPNLLITIGAIIFIISFLGCCGAIKQNYCMIISFSTLLILIFILEFAAGIAGYVLRNDTADYLNETLYKDLTKYGGSNSEVTFIWDQIQRTFNCCGIEGYKDWKIKFLNDSIPISCCEIPSGVVTYECIANETTRELHKIGCLHTFGDFLRDHAVSIGGVGLGFAVVQLFAILFSCHLAKKIKWNKNYSGNI